MIVLSLLLWLLADLCYLLVAAKLLNTRIYNNFKSFNSKVFTLSLFRVLRSISHTITYANNLLAAPFCFSSAFLFGAPSWSSLSSSFLCISYECTEIYAVDMAISFQCAYINLQAPTKGTNGERRNLSVSWIARLCTFFSCCKF